MVLWTALVAMCSFIFAANFIMKEGGGVLPDPAQVPSPMLKLLGRYTVGYESLSPGMAKTAGATKQIDDAALNVIDRIRAVAVIAEIEGKDAALSRLAKVEEEIDRAVTKDAVTNAAAGAGAGVLVFEDDAARRAMRGDVATLRAIYEAGTPGFIDAAERDALLKRHDWFGKLALTHGARPGDHARAAVEWQGRVTIFVLITLMLIIIAAVGVGLILFSFAAAMLAKDRLRPGLMIAERAGVIAPVEHGTPPGAAPTAPLEAMVLFLLGFIAMGVLAVAIEQATGLDLTYALVWGLGLMCFWPLVRGWPWRAWRYAIGWHAGRGFFREVGAGIVGYLAGLPIVGVGIVLTLAITMLTKADASHPIAGEIDLSNTWAMLGLFSLATVWAPLVEESIFRGALYRRLRGRMACPLAAIVCGFIFAIIHPQGYAGVPVLTSLGVVFCLLREWRGSLIGPIVAHAINNVFAVSVLMMVMG